MNRSNYVGVGYYLLEIAGVLAAVLLASWAVRKTFELFDLAAQLAHRGPQVYTRADTLITDAMRR